MAQEGKQEFTQVEALQILCNGLVIALRRGAFQNFEETAQIERALAMFKATGTSTGGDMAQMDVGNVVHDAVKSKQQQSRKKKTAVV